VHSRALINEYACCNQVITAACTLEVTPQLHLSQLMLQVCLSSTAQSVAAVMIVVNSSVSVSRQQELDLLLLQQRATAAALYNKCLVHTVASTSATAAAVVCVCAALLQSKCVVVVPGRVDSSTRDLTKRVSPQQASLNSRLYSFCVE
jgi:hypothetical protein